ncbi:MAG: VCBS repeat-containing protein, partial [Christiangramia sp.]
LVIAWPDGGKETLFDIKTNQTLNLSPSKDLVYQSKVDFNEENEKLFQKVDSIPGFSYTHKENSYNDFDRQKLIPYRISDKTPSVAIGDLNNDGLDDIFIGNPRGVEANIFIQKNNGFEKVKFPFLEETRNLEITDVAIADFNGDGLNDIFYVTGGGEFSGPMEVLKDACWTYINGSWKKLELPEYYSSGGIIKPADYDKDGDLDVFIGGYAIAGDYGRIPKSFLLENLGGKFRIVANKSLENSGMITDAVWNDINKDDYPELILVGEWMSPKIFRNELGKLSEVPDESLYDLTGLWQNIEAFDIDNDGDSDYLLGNWGLNSKFKASEGSPLRMYYGDLDNNGSTETVLANKKDGKYFTLNGLDELVSQMNYLRKKFPSYGEFSGKTVEEILGSEAIERSTILEVKYLESGYLRNDKGKFKFIPFNKNLQFAPINAILVSEEIDSSKNMAVLGGNYFGVTPYHGAFGAFPGALIKKGPEILSGPEVGFDFLGKALRRLEVFKINGESFLIGFLNDQKPAIYKIK